MECTRAIIPGSIYRDIYSDGSFYFNLYKIKVSAYGFLHYRTLSVFKDRILFDSVSYSLQGDYDDVEMIY